MILNRAQESGIFVDSDSRISSSVPTRNFRCRVSAAIINDRKIPVLIRLSEHALDTLGKILGAVVNGRDYTDQWL